VQHVEVPVPTPAKNQVLVKIEAAGINPADWKKVQSGAWKLFVPSKLPYIPGAIDNYEIYINSQSMNL